MRTLAIITALTLSLCSLPALANQTKPITDSDPDALDVAKTPVTDLNITKQEIPEVLITAQREPYATGGLRKCSQLITAVSELDELLGPDLDLPQEARDRISAGRVAKTVVGSFIPFRGLIREVSGANEHDRKVRAAIQAGLARRGFLKGIGLARGCAYPGRPATRRDVAAFLAEQQAEDDRKAKKDEKADAKKDPDVEETRFTSEPVIQRTK